MKLFTQSNYTFVLNIFVFVVLVFAVSFNFTGSINAGFCGGQTKCSFCSTAPDWSCGAGYDLNAGCGPNNWSCGPTECKCGSSSCYIGDSCEYHPSPTAPPPPPGGTPQPTPTPDPGDPPDPDVPEVCYHCVGYQCRAYDVDPGACYTDCGDNNCGGDDPVPVTCTRCNTSTFRCENYQLPLGETVCPSPCNPLTCVAPPFNYVKTCRVSRSAYTINTTQQISLTASGTSNAPVTETEPVRLILAKSDYSKWTNPPSGTLEQYNSSNNRYYYVYQTDPVLLNPSFENGKNYWSASNAIRASWSIVSNLIWPVAGTNGNYYLSAGREWVNDSASADAYIVSEWIDTSGDLTGQSFTLSLKAKAHGASKTIKGIILQRYPKVVGSTLDWSNTGSGFGDINIVSSGWTDFSRNVTLPYPTNGNNSTKMRIVLRVSSFGDGYDPVYYDHIRLSRNVSNTYNCSTSSSITCSDSVTIKGSNMTDGEITPGNYVAFCDMPTNPPPPDNRFTMCSGNPNCPFNGGTETSCSTWWKDCVNDAGAAAAGFPTDHTTFAVTLACSAPYCGVGGCPGTDLGKPPTVGNITIDPSAGTAKTLSADLYDNQNLVKMTSASNRVLNIIWDTPAIANNKTTKYEVYVWQRVGGLENLGQVLAAYPALGTAPGSATGTCFTYDHPTNPSLTNLYFCKYVINKTVLPTHQVQHTAVSNMNYKLRVAIRGINGNCPQAGDSRQGVFTLTSDISGKFYQTDSHTSCLATTPISMPASIYNLTNVSNNNSPANTQVTSSPADLSRSGSDFTLLNRPYLPTGSWGDHTISGVLYNTDPSNHYVFAACNAGTAVDENYTKANQVSPSTHNIFVLKVDISHGPWWQAVNGLVFAGGTFGSNIPSTCGTTESDCKNAMSIKPVTSADINSAGIPITSGASINSGDGNKSERANDTYSIGQDFSAVNTTKENYAYFESKFNLTDSSKVNILPATTSTITNINPTITYDGETRVLYKDGDLTIDPQPGGINIPDNRKIIVFVNGDLDIVDTLPTLDRLISVHQNSYLAFIVNGDITFSRDVGYTTTDANYSDNSLLPNVTGVFIAQNDIIVDSDLSTATTDKKFVGEGTFVAWGNFILRRNFSGPALSVKFHNGGPTEQFKYRPSYMDNTPASLKTPGIVWQERN